MSILTKTNPINFADLRQDFPIFERKNRGKPIVYLDSAASAQKPKQVVDAISQFYLQDYANIHRGIYELSERSSAFYENAREAVRHFIQAVHLNEIVFVRGTTEGINLVAQSFGRSHFKAGDEVLVSEMEHHSNLVPWYLLSKEIGIKLKIIPIKDDGSLDLHAYQALFSPRTKFATFCHASNVTGALNPVKEMVRIAHENNVPVLIDGAQAIAHLPVDVKDIDCDFYVFSGHKLYGPTGTGVLYGKKEILDDLPPYQGGGGMINSVSFSNITFAHAPKKFEAGTPDIAGAVGLHAAILYLQSIGMDEIYAHNQELLEIAGPLLLKVPGLKIVGHARPKVGVISFVIDGIHPHDIGTILDHEGIAIRASHHCAMPLMKRFSVPATVRVSFGIYNDHADIDALVNALHLTKRLFA
jgi:cysteine desulfurase/selenocysteine lyase